MYGHAFGGDGIMMQEFAQQVEDVIREATYDIHTLIPGTIMAYEPAAGLATVKPSGTIAMKNGDRLNYPEIVKVPVIFPRGNGRKAVIAYPVMPGDGCLILVCENDLKPWMSHGKETDSDMKFDLTNSVCIPGLFSDGTAAGQKAAKEKAIVIQNEDMMVVIKPDGVTAEYKNSRFEIGGASAELSCGGSKITAKSGRVEIDGDLVVHGSVTWEGGPT